MGRRDEEVKGWKNEESGMRVGDGVRDRKVSGLKPEQRLTALYILKADFTQKLHILNH